MKNMTKNNVDFLDDEEIIEELSNPRYKGGNIGLSPDASLEDRTKYRLCKSILAYQQDNKLTSAQAAKKLAISEKKFYEIARGNVNRFSFEELFLFLTTPCFPVLTAQITIRSIIRPIRFRWLLSSLYPPPHQFTTNILTHQQTQFRT